MQNGAAIILPLSRLTTGRRAVIHAHAETEGDSNESFRITLLEMGCIPGEPVWVEMVAPLGDPIAIRVAGYYLSIRKRDAERILVSVEQ